MSNPSFEAGDKIRRKDLDSSIANTVTRVLDYVGTEHVVYTAVLLDGRKHERTMHINNLTENFEKVPELFEAGKTYCRKASHTFETTGYLECLFADERIAFFFNRGTEAYTTRPQSARVLFGEISR